MATYYIDGGAAGGGDGSLSTPWNNLTSLETFDTAAAPGLVAGDIVKFKRGETVTGGSAKFLAAHGGTSGNPITWTTYYNGDGSDDTSVELPVIDLGNALAINSAWSAAGQGLTGIYLSDYTGTSILGLWEDMIYLEHADDIENIQAGQWWWNNASNPSYSLNGSYSTGLYYRPSDDANPDTHVVRRGSNGYGIAAVEVNYYTFENLHFKGGYYGIRFYGSATTSVSVIGVTVTNCKVSDCVYGISFEGRNSQNVESCTFSNNEIFDCGEAIFLGSYSSAGEVVDGCTIADNTIYRVNYDGRYTGYHLPDSEAIGLQNPKSCSIYGNTIFNCGDTSQAVRGTGIVLYINPTLGTFESNVIRNNSINNIITAGMILGAAVGAPSNGGNIVFSNVVLNCGDIGIKINTSSTSSIVFNNTISACDTSIHSQSTCSGWAVKNNLSYSPGSYHTWWNTSTNTSANNIFYPDGSTLYSFNDIDVTLSSWKTSVSDTTSIASDPFIGADYKPSLASPAKQAGSFVENTKDYAGNPFAIPPTIGAYEIVDVSSPVTMLSQSGVNMKTNIKTT